MDGTSPGTSSSDFPEIEFWEILVVSLWLDPDDAREGGILSVDCNLSQQVASLVSLV